MDEPTGKTYRPWEPQKYAAQAHSPGSTLPEGDLVYFLLDVIPKLDLAKFYAHYEKETRGAPPFDPGMMVCLLIYSYCMGVFSSRKIATACERNLAFLAIVGEDRPDFRTISDFRKIHLAAFSELFVQVLRLAGEAGMVKLGNIAIDGTKVKANASRHKAMSYGYMQKEVERLRAEIDQLLHQAEQADSEQDATLGASRGDELPDELKRRQERLEKIEAAMKRLEEQSKAKAEAERQRREQAEVDRTRDGGKGRGPKSKPVTETPAAKDQTNFTDPTTRIMQNNSKGWDYCGNAQASVDSEHQVIVAADVTVQANDKQQAGPMARSTRANLEQAGIAIPQNEAAEPQDIPATLDSGYFSDSAVEQVEAAGFDPHIAVGRQRHHQASPSEPDAAASPEGASPHATAKQKMSQKLQTPEGKQCYAKRKGIVEPVFGQLKGVRGFRQFLLRGLNNIRAEWRLICLTHNLLKIWRHRRVSQNVPLHCSGP
ncbi:MAG: transposase [Verrucomicrobiota bacterium]|jgi:transposase|nr:transposase [Verrucomicrobiota bacterium]|tara:strand:- start:152 stop:1609 length:1458 start_codon:yes stop_codon:yes gene_type:complete